jgi:hypothetical protein
MSNPARAPTPPFSRPLVVADLPADGLDLTIEATAEERAALARNFGLAGLERLAARFAVRGTPKRLSVTGRVEASLTQICVVTLEPFDSDLTEDVDVAFAEPGTAAAIAQEAAKPEGDADPPDDIVDGVVDLGALATELLALGLDPYPRKPGVAFDYVDAGTTRSSPFAALAKLKPPGEGAN